MTIYICNSFSLSMLDRSTQLAELQAGGGRAPTPISVDAARRVLDQARSQIVSAVGHADTARLFSAILDRPIEVNRVSVKLTPHDMAIVGQYVGPRLPEGATQLPEGATIEWWLV
jgi:hypothetical protein